MGRYRKTITFDLLFVKQEVNYKFYKGDGFIYAIKNRYEDSDLGYSKLIYINCGYEDKFHFYIEIMNKNKFEQFIENLIKIDGEKDGAVYDSDEDEECEMLS